MERMHTSEVRTENEKDASCVVGLRWEGYVTVTICPLPSLRMTTSQSAVSPVSRHLTSVGSNGFILTCIEPISTVKQQDVVGSDLSFLHKRPAQDYVEVGFFREIHGVRG